MQQESYDETLIRYLHEQMISSWNRSDSAGFAQPFRESADFIAFEGTHLKGRSAIELFHRQMFETQLRGTRLEGGVSFIRVIDPELAVMHSWITATLNGQTNASPSRDSLQLFVAVKQGKHWEFEAMLSARRVSIAQQAFADQFESWSALAQLQVARKVAAMRH
jgi:uncharacterized protein (TIGR02246 family)